jgi:hypothetical protein
MAVPKVKRTPLVIAAAKRQKWLIAWRQELETIRNDWVEWQKELHDRKFLNQLS